MSDAYEYMVVYKELMEQVGRGENIIGWYHSHPGYGCWLSGIDVATQRMNQTHNEPFLAIVIDPVRTCSSGKVGVARGLCESACVPAAICAYRVVCMTIQVEIGAFRAYPPGHKPLGRGDMAYQSIPLDKIEDFGVHADE